MTWSHLWNIPCDFEQPSFPVVFYAHGAVSGLEGMAFSFPVTEQDTPMTPDLSSCYSYENLSFNGDKHLRKQKPCLALACAGQLLAPWLVWKSPRLGCRC